MLYGTDEDKLKQSFQLLDENKRGQITFEEFNKMSIFKIQLRYIYRNMVENSYLSISVNDLLFKKDDQQLGVDRAMARLISSPTFSWPWLDER